MVRLRLDGGIELVERRRSPRAKVPFRFTTSVRLGDDSVRYFVSHPVDISSGGVRLTHRLPLAPGDRFRLSLWLKPNAMTDPVAEVIETGEQTPTRGGRRGPTTYVSRAAFVELRDDRKELIERYVAWQLGRLQRQFGPPPALVSGGRAAPAASAETPRPPRGSAATAERPFSS